MGYVYKRGKKLWIGYIGRDGKPKQVATGLDVGQKRKAQQYLDRIEARIAAGAEFDEAELGAVTVERYAEKWVEARKTDGIVSANIYEGHLRLHVNPQLGKLKMEEVRTRHIRDFVKNLKRGNKLAPRSIHYIYGVLRTMFKEAVVDELIDFSPCVLKRGDLPKKVDKDPTWRADAVFTRDELELLISDDRVPEDRRVLYTLMGVAGLRIGEASAVRWRHYDPALEPLGRLMIACSYNTDKREEKAVKTEQPRQVPVHKTLANILAEWKIGGWQRMMGRPATSDDLIIPSRRGRNRSRRSSLKSLQEDLELLQLRPRRQHDLRRTFITLARTDDARKDVLEFVTHAPRGDIMNLYTSLPWPLLCKEVAKLNVELLKSKVIELPKVAAAGGQREGGHPPTCEKTRFGAKASLTVPLTVGPKATQPSVIARQSPVGAHHPTQWVSGIPSAVILLRISQPTRCSTRCPANVRDLISRPMIAL